MNPKIKELKISNYKKRIVSDYSFLKISNIYFGDEDPLNVEFCKVAVNSSSSDVNEFSFYDQIERKFKDERLEHKKALNYFNAEARKLFENDEEIVFNISFAQEHFRIESIFKEMISNFYKIKFSDQTIFLFDKKRTKHISLLRMEYSFEVITYTKQ